MQKVELLREIVDLSKKRLQLENILFESPHRRVILREIVSLAKKEAQYQDLILQPDFPCCS